MSAAAPLGGRIFTRGFNTLLALGGVAIAVLVWRFIVGLGPTTGMNDGYAWGIWIAFDVVTGTAIACGGYAMALIVYIFNKGKYHPLVRPALLTTALGYTIAGLSVFVDIGRWWNAWKLSFFWRWNVTSVLLEVALCIMTYMVVAWIEVSHSVMEKWEREAMFPILTRVARLANPILEKALPFAIALGILLPTMHQSSLGSLFLISTKLHPLWHTRLLPLLFLVSVVGMGYAGVVLESTISGFAFKLPSEWKLLGNLSKSISVAFFAYLAIRVGALALNGFPGFGWNGLSVLLVIELALFAAPAVLLLSGGNRQNPGIVFLCAMLALLAGAVYRFDTYLVAFDPGPGWHYFPSIPEMLVTLGFIALEIAAYVLIVKLFPILRPARSVP
jgi:Ni/Fe-hydrogenase subunit HybB-like protein